MIGSGDVVVAALKGRVQRYSREFAAELCARIVRRTPVDTGSLRASWTASLGAPETRNVNLRGNEQVRRDPRNVLVIARMEPGDRFFFTNGQPYARRIEYGAHSPQAPQGMVHITLAEMGQVNAWAIQEAKRGG